MCVCVCECEGPGVHCPPRPLVPATANGLEKPKAATEETTQTRQATTVFISAGVKVKCRGAGARVNKDIYPSGKLLEGCSNIFPQRTLRSA